MSSVSSCSSFNSINGSNRGYEKNSMEWIDTSVTYNYKMNESKAALGNWFFFSVADQKVKRCDFRKYSVIFDNKSKMKLTLWDLTLTLTLFQKLMPDRRQKSKKGKWISKTFY